MTVGVKAQTSGTRWEGLRLLGTWSKCPRTSVTSDWTSGSVRDFLVSLEVGVTGNRLASPLVSVDDPLNPFTGQRQVASDPLVSVTAEGNGISQSPR